MLNKRLLDKPLETKFCRECEQYQEHVGGTLCVGCSLDEEDVEWYIQNVESQKEDVEEKKQHPQTPQPLTRVESGDSLYLSNGTTTRVTEVTSRSVKTEEYSFVKSDGTGWGSTDIDAAPNNT